MLKIERFLLDQREPGIKVEEVVRREELMEDSPLEE
jgi:hypothetical protein